MFLSFWFRFQFRILGEVVSAAGFSPALPRFQAGHVAATPRADCPGDSEGAGGLVLLEAGRSVPGRRPAVRLALPVGLAPTLFPQTTGCFSIQLREQTLEIKRAGSAAAPGPNHSKRSEERRVGKECRYRGSRDD